jgi:hypothetical protein
LAAFSKTQNMAKIGQKLNANPLTFFQKKSWLTPSAFTFSQCLATFSKY